MLYKHSLVDIIKPLDHHYYFKLNNARLKKYKPVNASWSSVETSILKPSRQGALLYLYQNYNTRALYTFIGCL